MTAATGDHRRRARVPVLTAAGVVGLVVSGCGFPFPGTTLSEQVTGWASMTGFSAQVRTVQQDVARSATVVSTHQVSAIRTVCDVLVTDVLAANQNLPTPDQTLTGLLAGAYASAGDAGRDCLRGAGGDAALLARSAAERARAQKELIEAQARFDSLTTPVPAPVS